MRVRCQQCGSVYHLAPADRRGKGAGGEVYAVANGTRAVKVMKRPEAAKLRTLMHFRKALEPVGVVCPQDLVVDELTGEVVGYVMRLAPGRTVEERPPADITPRQRLLAALGLARGVQAVHGLKVRVVLRDLKDANVLVDYSADPPAVSIIDFDSACVFGVRGENGVDKVDYVATYHTPGCNPLEHVVTPGLIPTPATDLFALGGVLFTLVFGRSPYDVVGRAVGDLNRAVKERRFPRYVQCGRAPTYAVTNVPAVIDELFRICFVGTPADRPTAARWVQELEAWVATDPDPVPHQPPTQPVPVRWNFGRLKAFTRWTVAGAILLAAVGGPAAMLLGIRHLPAPHQPTPPSPPTPPPQTAPAGGFFPPSVGEVFEPDNDPKK